MMGSFNRSVTNIRNHSVTQIFILGLVATQSTKEVPYDRNYNSRKKNCYQTRPIAEVLAVRTKKPKLDSEPTI